MKFVSILLLITLIATAFCEHPSSEQLLIRVKNTVNRLIRTSGSKQRFEDALKTDPVLYIDFQAPVHDGDAPVDCEVAISKDNVTDNFDFKFNCLNDLSFDL